MTKKSKSVVRTTRLDAEVSDKLESLVEHLNSRRLSRSQVIADIVSLVLMGRTQSNRYLIRAFDEMDIDFRHSILGDDYVDDLIKTKLKNADVNSIDIAEKVLHMAKQKTERWWKIQLFDMLKRFGQLEEDIMEIREELDESILEPLSEDERKEILYRNVYGVISREYWNREGSGPKDFYVFASRSPKYIPPDKEDSG